MGLLSVADALSRLLDDVEPLEPENTGLHEAAGRVLAEPIAALRTQPPFDASAMDGYAVRAADIETVPALLRLIGEAPAGRPFSGGVGSGEAVRIFTCAPLPDGADTILIQENARRVDQDTVEATEPTARGRHIRKKGLDFVEGEALLPAGRTLDPAALSLAAAANHAALPVVRRPRVALIATGDELVLPGGRTGPGQIIASNAYGIAAIVEAAGGQADDLGIVPDKRAAIRASVDAALSNGADAIVSIGGASVGDHDLMREVLVGMGMELDFWKIAMRPGKPLMFGRFGKVRVLGLPGNPVASLVCSHLFVKPLVARLAGSEAVHDFQDGVLGADMAANDLREDYVRARTRVDGSRLVATPFEIQDSSMLRTLAEAGGLIVRPPHTPAARAGDPCRVLVLR
jgi:molybdopterin molybdotransferase